MTLASQKAAARKAAFARRKAVHRPGMDATQALQDLLSSSQGAVISGYMPIRTEIDPLPAMQALSVSNLICVPVITSAGAPLEFHHWTPGCEMVEGPFGASIPANGKVLQPDILIVPLLAYTVTGDRLGYGGGFYDRTLEKLRAFKPVKAYGFAYAAQRSDTLPLEQTDQPLDAIVTETQVLTF